MIKINRNAGIIVYHILWGFAFFAKLIVPSIFLSWIESFLLYLPYARKVLIFFPEITWVILFLVLFCEFCLALPGILKTFEFLKLNFIILVIFLGITIFSFFNNIPGDCGCFGKILVWENNIYKVIFNFLLTLGAFFLLYGNITKPEVKKIFK